MDFIIEFFNSAVGGAIVAFIFVCILAAIFAVPVGMFNTKMYEGNNGFKPTGGEWFKCYIPFANIRYARVLAYGASPVFAVCLIVALIVFLLRFIAIGLVAMDVGFMVYVYMFSAMFPLIAVGIWWVLAAINGVDFGNMLGAGLFTKLFCVILPPLGYYMLSNAVLPYFKAEEVSLGGTFGAEN